MRHRSQSLYLKWSLRTKSFRSVMNCLESKTCSRKEIILNHSSHHMLETGQLNRGPHLYLSLIAASAAIASRVTAPASATAVTCQLSRSYAASPFCCS